MTRPEKRDTEAGTGSLSTAKGNATLPTYPVIEGSTFQERSTLFRRSRLATAAVVVFLLVGRARTFALQNPAPDQSQTQPPAAKPDEINILLPPPDTTAARIAPTFPEVKIPNFTSCPISEIRSTVPELAHLKAVQDQSQLFALIDKIGDKTVDVARKTPNVISDEAVVSDDSGVRMEKKFSFLVLQHSLGSKGVIFDEYRVDVASGQKFQSEDFEKEITSNTRSTATSSLDLPSMNQTGQEPNAAPRSQGFVNDWLYFYPTNRQQSDFRYLGQQKMDGHQTLVVAFAQKPARVRFPAMIGFQNKALPVYMQGVAWVDASDFRIVRLRTDLLLAPSGVPLRQLTADIQFAQIAVAELASPLWLPRQVVVATNLAGMVHRESHTYSNYRLFRAHSKVILNP